MLAVSTEVGEAFNLLYGKLLGKISCLREKIARVGLAEVLLKLAQIAEIR